MTRKPIDSDFVANTVDAVLDENPQLVDAYLLGKHGAVNDLVGKIVAQSNGKISEEVALSAVKARLDGER